MRQLFFISPHGFMPVRQALCGDSHITGVGTHGWAAPGDDPHKDQIIGVAELNGNVDAEVVIERLEAQGILWLPNHLFQPDQVIAPEHAQALAKHGVLPTHTTREAMTVMHAVSGFPPLKPKRF